MFEKEAEEYAENREVCGLLDAISEDLQNYDYGTVAHYNIDPLIEECFKDGAEFGYNKAKEEMQEQGLALQSDMDKTIEQNIQLKNQNNWLEGCKLELAEHLGKANDRISELEQQIEKMKCCGNCEHFNFSEPNYCHKGVYRERQYVCSEWKFGN